MPAKILRRLRRVENAPDKKHIGELHVDYAAWTKELEAARDELGVLIKRLEEVSSRNSDVGVRANVEHFQNIFIRHNEVIDETLHKIKLADNALAESAKKNTTASDHQLFDDNAALRDEMRQFSRIYANVRADFNSFLAKWM